MKVIVSFALCAALSVTCANAANLELTNRNNIEPTAFCQTTKGGIGSRKMQSEAEAMTLRDGKYIIGKDINPGNYTITCTGTAGESAGDAHGSLGNMMDSLDGNSGNNWGALYGSLGDLMEEYIDMTVEILGDYGDVLKSYSMKKGDSFTIMLEADTALQITDGSCTIQAE